MSSRVDVARTTAGLTLLLAKSVNGKGTTTTSPATNRATPHPPRQSPSPATMTWQPEGAGLYEQPRQYFHPSCLKRRAWAIQPTGWQSAAASGQQAGLWRLVRSRPRCSWVKISAQGPVSQTGFRPRSSSTTFNFSTFHPLQRLRRFRLLLPKLERIRPLERAQSKPHGISSTDSSGSAPNSSIVARLFRRQSKTVSVLQLPKRSQITFGGWPCITLKS